MAEKKSEKKLIIQPHRYGNETSVISVRLPKDMLAVIDRVAAVRDILDQLPTDPTALELEQMGSYILYGKDENGLNAV